MKKVAILGATGYIGKSLLAEFLVQNSDDQIYVFSREIEKLEKTMLLFKDSEKSSLVKLCHLPELDQGSYDVIINATGIGNTKILNADPATIFTITESIDNLVLSYVRNNPKTVYINISSGAVYGDNFSAPITEETKATFSLNEFKVSEYYSVAKLHAEAKHRALKDYNIIDLRVFAFFSRFADPKAEFLMSEIVDCLVSDKVFKTNSADIVRDFITPDDLFRLIQSVVASPSNNALDVYSRAPIAKFDLLRELEQKFGLRYEISSDPIRGGNKFSKNIYFSENYKAEHFGYSPSSTSLEGICTELSKIITK
jgi:nucleoside-diphosphate-sugar epimerase